MKIGPGLSALVTGGADGIGKALCLALAKKGVFVTVVDFSEENGRKLVSLLQKDLENFHPTSKTVTAQFVYCDVTNSDDLSNAFNKHLKEFGGLDICINCAGVATEIPFHADTTNGMRTWRRTVHVNLMALIDCTRVAVQIMRVQNKPGVILNIGSASGISPFFDAPVYAATKAGVVMFSRSLAYLKKEGIRVNVLCPEFVFTELAKKVDPRIIRVTGGFLPMTTVLSGAFELIEDETRAGSCLWITNRKGMEYWPSATEEKRYLVDPHRTKKNTLAPNKYKVEISEAYRKIIVYALNHKFRDATKVVTSRLSFPIRSDHVLVKIIFAGVNASDVNFSSGRYFSGKDAASRLPFDAGFEAVGITAAIGNSVTEVEVGTPVAVMTYGSYAEFVVVPAKHVIPVAKPDPEIVAMLTSGLTASIALEKAGQLQSGQVVLITAAAGGTGQFAVQLAKLARNKVIATCGGEQKVKLLKELGVDRVIDYKSEDMKAVLKKEFPNGVDIVYESVGGNMFDICLNALAPFGRIIVIGMISQYQGEHGWRPLNYTGLCEKILAKSQTVAGFFLVQYSHLYRAHLERLYNLFSSGKLKVFVDPKQFIGLDSVADAVEYLHSGDSHGKVVVCIDPSFAQQRAKL